MVEEEDWDASTPTTPTAPTTCGSNATPNQTLRITDGYKYSYEALASPANNDDWVEPTSYGGSKRSNGYGDGRPFRQERNISNRFDPTRRNDSSSQDKSLGKSFGTPKPRFSNRPPVPRVEDWDAPDASASQENGAWKPAPVSTLVLASTPAVDEDDWDAAPGDSSIHRPPQPAVDIPTFNPATARQSHAPAPQTDKIPVYSPRVSRHANSIPNHAVEEDEDWDAPSGTAATSRTPVAPDIPLFRPSSVSSTPQPSQGVRSPEPPSRSEPTRAEPSRPQSSNEEEDWDEPSGASCASKPQPAFEIPIFRPPTSHSSGSNSPVIKPPAPSTSGVDDEENWDDDAPTPVATEIPIFKPSNQTQGSDDQRSDSNRSTKLTLSKGFGERGCGGSGDRGFGGGRGFGGDRGGFGRDRGFGGRGRDRSFSGDRGSSGGSRDQSFSGDRHDRGFGKDRGDRGFGKSNDRRFGQDRGDRGFGGGSADRGFGGGDRGLGDKGADRGFKSNSRGFGGGSGDRDFGKSIDRGFGGGEKGFGDRGDRGFGGGEKGFGDRGDRGFGRESFNNRHSRGNRHSPYERNGDRGDRGGRGGRGGGRGGRGGFRDSGGDRDWGNKPFGRSFADRNKNDSTFSSPAASFGKPVPDEEDWDTPSSSSASKPAEKRSLEPKPAFLALPIDTSAAVPQDEESWD